MISDSLAFIYGYDPHNRPQVIPYQRFKNVDGLKKPSKRLANENWKHLSRRRFIRNHRANLADYELTEEEQENYKLEAEEAAKDPNYDPLERKYDLEKLDLAIAEEDNWDDLDKVDDEDDFESMEERHQRKKQNIIDKLYEPYDHDSAQATKNLNAIASEISATFKSLLFINCVFLATRKNWISFFLNAGCLLFSKTVFNQIRISHFNFTHLEGMLFPSKILYLSFKKQYFTLMFVHINIIYKPKKNYIFTSKVIFVKIWRLKYNF